MVESIGGCLYGAPLKVGLKGRCIVLVRGARAGAGRSNGRDLLIVLSISVLRRLTATGRTREERRKTDKF